MQGLGLGEEEIWGRLCKQFSDPIGLGTVARVLVSARRQSTSILHWQSPQHHFGQ
jgi:hypothetical protein